MCFGYRVRSAPGKERHACLGQALFNSSIVAIVGFLIDCLAGQAKNPRLDISLRNQVNYRLVIVTTRQSAVGRSFGELSSAGRHIENIGVYGDHKPGSDAGVPFAELLNFIRIFFTHVLLTGSFAGGKCDLADRATFKAFAGEVFSNETLLPLVLDEDDDPGWLTQAPIHVQPVQLA